MQDNIESQISERYLSLFFEIPIPEISRLPC